MARYVRIHIYGKWPNFEVEERDVEDERPYLAMISWRAVGERVQACIEFRIIDPSIKIAIDDLINKLRGIASAISAGLGLLDEAHAVFLGDAYDVLSWFVSVCDKLYRDDHAPRGMRAVIESARDKKTGDMAHATVKAYYVN